MSIMYFVTFFAYQPFNPSAFNAGKVKRGALAAGRKITRIISFSKKKAPRPGDPRTPYSDPRQGQTPLHSHSSVGLGTKLDTFKYF